MSAQHVLRNHMQKLKRYLEGYPVVTEVPILPIFFFLKRNDKNLITDLRVKLALIAGVKKGSK